MDNFGVYGGNAGVCFCGCACVYGGGLTGQFSKNAVGHFGVYVGNMGSYFCGCVCACGSGLMDSLGGNAGAVSAAARMCIGGLTHQFGAPGTASSRLTSVGTSGGYFVGNSHAYGGGL